MRNNLEHHHRFQGRELSMYGETQRRFDIWSFLCKSASQLCCELVVNPDYATNKLFWVDAKLHMICSSDLDGSQQKIVLMSLEHLKHPFSVAVFEVTRLFNTHADNSCRSKAFVGVCLSVHSIKPGFH